MYTNEINTKRGIFDQEKTSNYKDKMRKSNYNQGGLYTVEVNAKSHLTPNINNHDKTLEDIEMRKTQKTKPHLMTSKLPPAFDFPNRAQRK